MLMGFDDGSVYARGESEIVGVDDETAHAKSLAGEVDSRAGWKRLRGLVGLTVLSALAYTQ
jgi:hypothetical protein